MADSDNPTAYLDDNGSWNHNTFICSLGTDSFADYRAAMEHNFRSEMTESGGSPQSPSLDPQVKKLLDLLDEKPESVIYMSRRKCRSTELGGSDAINSLYQYNENDDVMHRIHYADKYGLQGLSRVYSEQIDDLQQIVYLSFGTPVFNNLNAFYHHAVDTNLADLMNQGPTLLSAEKIGRLVGAGIGAIISFPTMGLVFINNMIGGMIRTPVTKYYDFRSQMALYYRFVQTILVEIGVNLGVVENKWTNENTPDGTTSTQSNTNPNVTPQEILKATALSQGGKGAPDYISDYTLDIFKILGKRYMYANGLKATDIPSTDQALNDVAGSSVSLANSENAAAGDGSLVTFTKNMVNSFISDLSTGASDFWSARAGALYDTTTFIGLRIDGGVTCSESFDNRTKESEIQGAINSKMAGAREKAFDSMDGNYSGGAIAQAMSAAAGGAKAFFGGLTNQLGLTGLTAIATGSGMIDIPKVWDDSSFSQNYSFRLQLRSPYGDPLSILQTNYVPLACLLAGALPRAIGSNAYTSPFLCRAYCKGMLSIPLGMITSLEVVRGGDTHGWSIGRLPTSLDINFTISNMAPRLYMSMGESSGIYASALGESSNFSEYLATLSGMGLYERLDSWERLQRRTDIWAKTLLKTKLSPGAWGNWAGNLPIMKGIYNILPVGKLAPD